MDRGGPGNADSVERIVDEIVHAVRSSKARGESRSQRSSRINLRQLIRDRIRETLKRKWEVRVPGSYARGGITNADLFQFLAKGGRDFLDVNRPMVTWLIAQLDNEFERGDHVPFEDEIVKEMTVLMREHITERMEGSVRDIRVRNLTYRYAKAKAKAGYGGNPVGVRTGKLKASVARAVPVFY